MFALRLLAIMGLFALSTIPFAVAASDDDEPHQIEGDLLEGQPQEDEEAEEELGD